MGWCIYKGTCQVCCRSTEICRQLGNDLVGQARTLEHLDNQSERAVNLPEM